MQVSELSEVTTCGADCALVGGAVSNTKGGTTPAVGRWNGQHWTVAILPVPPGRDSDAVISLISTGAGSLLGTTGGIADPRAPYLLWQCWHGRWAQIHLSVGQHPVKVFELAAIPHTPSVWALGGYANLFTFALMTVPRHS
jgi:hypothetical protein